MKQAYEYLTSLATIALVVAGLGGLAFNAFRESGWIASTLAGAWTFEMEYPLLAVPLTIAAIAVFFAWRNHYLVHGGVNRVPTLLVYCLMAAGAFFIGQFVLYGSL